MDREKTILDTGNTELIAMLRLIDLLKKSLEAGMQIDHNRSLPFNELLFDRWERSKQLGFGEGTSVYDSCCIFGSVDVGNNTWVGPFTILDGSGGLTIGDHCSISAGVQIYSHDSVAWAVSGGAAPYEYARTIIGSRCYIGPNTIIAKGVTIGSGTIIGANSFVNQSFPENSKIAGSPARIIN